MYCAHHLHVLSPKPVSINKSKKVLVSKPSHSLSKSKTQKRQQVLQPRSHNMTERNRFPKQVSDDQGSSDRSEFAFSSGASLPVNSASRFVLGDREQTLNRLNGNILNTVITQTELNRQANIAHSSTTRTNISNRSAITPPPRHPGYVDIGRRLQSFARWIHRRPDPTALANAGFFFTNDSDLVRCHQCGIGLKDFCEEDNPLNEHVKHSGSCPYLLEYIGTDRLAETKRRLQCQDPEYNRRVQWSERHRHDPANAIYRHPEYETLQARLSSFNGWPQHMLQTPKQLADAGLYYTGFDDRVRCFACDGGLQRWDPDDDPWTEHCRWFPACPYARIQKGDDFIAAIQASVAMGNEENFGGNGISAALERMELRDPALQAILNERKEACLDMGYTSGEFDEAIKELRERGTQQPQFEEIIDVIEVIKARKIQDDVLSTIKDETPVEENRRLRNNVICMACCKNETNCLFLPCTHHRVCMECAAPLIQCPVCNKNIRQKIRTFMA